MFELGGWYLTGASDVSTGFKLQQSDSESLRWVTLAADAGLPRAMFAMGYFLETGIGHDSMKSDVDESSKKRNKKKNKSALKEAIEWYKKAADAGDEKALSALQDKGVTIDRKEAGNYFWGGSGGLISGTSLGSFDVKTSGLFSRTSSRKANLDDELDGGEKCSIM